MEEAVPAATRARRRRSLPGWRMVAGAAAAVFLVASLGIWLAVSASALGGLVGGSGHHTATATKTATPSPSPTASPTRAASPTTTTASPTTDPQKALDQQAAASFRSVTLTTFVDNACGAGNARTSFGPGQTLYVNLCTSGAAANALTAVYVRQGGTVLYTLEPGQYIGPGQHYFVYRYGIPAGSYDCWVTQQINGAVATAADIRFTVG